MPTRKRTTSTPSGEVGAARQPGQSCQHGQHGQHGITVVLALSTEPMDMDAWAARYVRALIAADRAIPSTQAEAA
jgi:hypothetical protein